MYLTKAVPISQKLRRQAGASPARIPIKVTPEMIEAAIEAAEPQLGGLASLSRLSWQILLERAIGAALRRGGRRAIFVEGILEQGASETRRDG